MRLAEVLDLARGRGTPRVAVAGGASAEALRALAEAKAAGLIAVTLCGPLAEVRKAAAEGGYDLEEDQLVPAAPDGAAVAAVREVAEGRAALLMKGSVSTAELLRAALAHEFGLRTGRLLSHVGIFELPGLSRLLFLTDAGVNIAPTLAQKADLIRNAVEVARACGVEEPKVAALAAVEVVNPEMPATTDAACLAAMSRRGQIRGAVVDGPLALDNAVLPEAAERKGIGGPVAGAADVLLVPDIEAGNMAYKALLFFGQAKVAGVVVGARVPIITTSRAEEHETKLLSIALGVVMATGAGH
ncbi:MAG TPA: bifunctional enoyl-CoA hydratase/phosphate acetyltransferase [Firmicutes bacterium]|nr:bifunctional enoyl-CoA hydratase/phosphate acetyltransferase [Bacillota bacterium]